MLAIKAGKFAVIVASVRVRSEVLTPPSKGAMRAVLKIFMALILAITPGCSSKPARPVNETTSATGDAVTPNIVFILSDNLGYGELGAYGGGITRGAAAPRIDSLAKDGTRLLNANMETQCTPSRSSLLTGRWAIRSGTHPYRP